MKIQRMIFSAETIWKYKQDNACAVKKPVYVSKNRFKQVKSKKRFKKVKK